MPTNDPCRGPILSSYADDPEMAELVELFVTDLPERVASLRSALASRDVRTLRTISHQMKGAAAGYGFPQLGEAAASIEDGLRCGDEEAALSRLRAQVDALIDMCGRVRLSV